MRSYEMNMTEGSIGKKLLIYSVPLMLTGILQLLYNAFDIIVLGQFSSTKAMAAVTSTSALVSLFVNFFLGFSAGASVIMAKFYGARDHERAQKCVHTAILSSVIVGIIVSVLGASLATPLLRVMNTPENMLDLASLYVEIYLGGIIFNIIYNFGAALLRAVGDTKRPLIFLTIAGVLNVCFNLLFVIVFKMDVAGVALGTIISEFVSAVLVIITLMRSTNVLHLSLRKLRIDFSILKDIFKIGIPAGIQSLVFSVSNVMIQSKINLFGENAIAGNGVASSLENFVYAGMNAVYQGTITFTSQNLGAGKVKNAPKVLWYSYLYVFLANLIFGGIILLLPKFFISIYNSDPNVIIYAKERLLWMLLTYFICGFMDCTSGALRGLGYSTSSMILTILGIVGFRITWILTFFNYDTRLANLYLSYPLSWVITWVIELAVFVVLYKRVKILRKNMNNLKIML